MTLTPKSTWGVSALAGLTLAGGLLLTGAMAASARTRVYDQARARFQRSNDLLAMELKRRLMLPGYGLKGARAAFAASPEMGRAGFQAYVAARDLDTEFPGLQGFGVIERVERSQLEVFLNHQRTQGAPSFEVREDGGGPDLYVVTTIEPLANNRAAWGLDLAAAPLSRAAIEHAVDTGLVTLSASNGLERGGSSEPSRLLLAVYRPGPVSTVAERRAALIALVFASFDPAQLLQGTSVASDGMIDFDVYTSARGAPEDLLPDPDGHLTHSLESGGGRRFVSEQQLELDGRVLLLRTRSTQPFDATIDLSIAVTRLVAGTALSLLAATVVWLLGRGRARALQLATKMTREAEEARQQAELAQREQRAMDLLIREQFIVSVAGPDGRIIGANDAMCAISGFTREELYGKDHRVLGSGTHTRDFWREVWKTVASGRPWRGEICNRAKNGTLYWVDALIAPFFMADGRVAKYVSIRTDITERKATEAQLERQSGLAVVMAAQAEEANMAKSSFLANMSHEIRTPMNGVLGMTELLLGMGLNPEQDHAARTVYRSAEALLVILNDILDFSKIEAGRLEFERISFDVRQLLEDCMELFRGKVAGRPVELEVHITEGAPAFVWGDPSRLRQVITNLVSNAVKFTAAGHVWLELHRVEGRLVIRVVDTGPGIPLARQSALFQPFIQSDVSTSRRHGGTGLGLAISRRLAEGMGGQVTLHSVVGEGTRFEVDLPLDEDLTVPLSSTRQPRLPPRSEVSRPRLVALPSPPPSSDQPRLRVLLAEDNAVNQHIARAMLEKRGCEVVVVNDGSEAVTAFLKERWDVIFMDCQMPELDGYEATERIRAHESARGLSRTPVIAMTANVMPEDRARCLAAGMDDHLPKPTRAAELAQMLSAWAPIRAAPAATGS
ncbi:MAG: CHASE domain-containing protein [Archangium sp.]|nr:CHASE domain-containing protein [Archangium sp.]MDP3574570.1 CHASE domain-containing protein [Archangium sp.]